MYSASNVERATVLCILLPHTTGPPHIMAIKPVLVCMLLPSPNEESCHIMGSSEMMPLNVRQKDMVQLRYIRIRLACAQWETVGLAIYLLRWLTTMVMS